MGIGIVKSVTNEMKNSDIILDDDIFSQFTAQLNNISLRKYLAQ